ncbi:MAG: FAD-dependent thymidylate synthase [Planctomycetota bacterium]
MSLPTFLSAAPEVRLVNAFRRPFENAVATARTCYSAKGIITAEDVGADAVTDPAEKEAAAGRRDALARSIYEAGHHTTLQHAHFQFALSNVSRQFLWSFLHSHPFYNSEQVSQRYVEVKRGTYAIPPMPPAAAERFTACVDAQMEAYHALIEMLTPIAAAEYYRLFPARKKISKHRKDVKKKAQEVARYVLPVATFAFLYHTVSGLTVLRYWRACDQYDAPLETRIIVGRMVEEMLAADPLFKAILEEPLPIEETVEARLLAAMRGEPSSAAFRAEFDRSLGGRVSKLIDWKARNEEVLAQSVREVLGLPSSRLSDDEAIAWALSPERNRAFGETMNVTTLSKLSRALVHPSYTFRKRLSHTGDSQDQRHRMTPASRPVLCAHLSDEPDFLTPELVKRDPKAEKLYVEAMSRAWECMTALRAEGVPVEFASYVLPNALAIRFTESSDLLNLHHKLKARLCYNAQEEIWRASVDETQQIREVNSRIGRYIGPPCLLRWMSRSTPFCPEGERYCGVPVWKVPLEKYERVI